MTSVSRGGISDRFLVISAVSEMKRRLLAMALLLAGTLPVSAVEQVNSVSGKWYGHAHSAGVDQSVEATITQHADQVQATLKAIGKDGTSKHYFFGRFNSQSNELTGADKGIDIDWGSPGWYPQPVSSYSLQLVEDGNKLVGSAKVSGQNDPLWFALSREGTAAKATAVEEKKPTATAQPAQVEDRKIADVPTLKTDEPPKKKAEGKVTPDVVAYMTYIERTLKTHWHPPHGAKTRSVTTLFKIEKDGSVSDVHLESAQPGVTDMIDETTAAALDAVKLSAPFTPPSSKVLSDSNDDHLDIRFKFDYNVHHRAVPWLPLRLGRTIYMPVTQ